MRGAASIGAVLAAQRPALVCWLAVAFGSGAGVYFLLPGEPGLALRIVLAGVILGGLAIMLWRPAPGGLALVAAFAAAGLLAGGLRAERVAAPVLERAIYGAVEGRVRAVDTSRSERPRLTLDEVHIDGVAPGRTPHRVRVSLHADTEYHVPRPGQRIIVTARLLPPGGPVEPGGYDFQRQSWFQGLGAVGYTRLPLLLLEEAPPTNPGVRLAALRSDLAQGLRDRVPGAAGPFAAAILVGERSGIPAEVLEDLRRSNLAHLLAISGLHMGLLTGLVFFVVRGGLALIPGAALGLPLKKIAAVVALGAAAAYLALSGANVATQRAFIMASVFLGAILLGRRAFTLNSVALAALVVLVLRPESVVEPGFQMSFAATTALVAAFRGLHDSGAPRARGRFLRGTLNLALASVVAEVATGPISAFHFNRFSNYGLIANLASVPAMGFVVMPAGVLGTVLAPLGLDGPAFVAMGLGIDWIAIVAAAVAGMEGAAQHVASPPAWVLPVMMGGAVWVILWQGRGRWLGAAPVVVALVFWSAADRPAVLVSADGALVGVLGPEGRALNRPRGQGFAAQVWLENDGDPVAQPDAAARGAFLPGGRAPAQVFPLAGGTALHLSGKDQPSEFLRAACEEHLLVILPEADWPAGPIGPCLPVDKNLLAAEGSIAILLKDGQPVLRGARSEAGARLWNAVGTGRTAR